MSDYYWLAVHLRTGDVLADLPLLTCAKIARQIGTYTTTEADLPVGPRGTPENWLRATLPGGTALVLIDGSRDDAPVWGGMITQRTRTDDGPVRLSLATLEAYFDRRYVGDRVYTGVGQNALAADLVEWCAVQGTNGGVPFRLAPRGDGQVRDLTTADDDDRTLYSVLQTLMTREGGPEWTVEWEWAEQGRRLRPVFIVGDRIGSPPPPGLAPNAVFELPGAIASIELAEDFTSAAGANDVLATSSASAGVRPQSAHHTFVDADRPTFEYRFSPSTSIKTTDVLDDHAADALSAMADGARPLSLSATTAAAPRVGVDWHAGDDVGYVVPSVPAFPGGLSGTARTVGWTLAFATDSAPEIITPTLQVED